MQDSHQVEQEGSEVYIKLLKELVHFLLVHRDPYSMPSDIAEQKAKVESMGLNELKRELFPWCQYYYGNLLKPAFTQVLNSFIETNSQHTHLMGGMEHYLKALEFALEPEIHSLQACYDDATDHWGKTLTKEEHDLLLMNSPPLKDKKTISKFIKDLLKAQKKMESSKQSRNDSTRGMIVEEEGSKQEESMPMPIQQILERIAPSLLKISPAASQAGKKESSKTIIMPESSLSGAQQHEVKKKPGPGKKEARVDDLETGKVIMPGPESSSNVQSSGVLTRKRKGQLISAAETTFLSGIMARQRDGGSEMAQQLLLKEYEMLECLKWLKKKYKVLGTPVKLWEEGFSKLYLFWMDLIIGMKLEGGTSSSLSSWEEVYKEEDDNHFVLLLGQPQAELLHKMEYSLSHLHPGPSSRGKEVLPSHDDDDLDEGLLSEEDILEGCCHSTTSPVQQSVHSLGILTCSTVPPNDLFLWKAYLQLASCSGHQQPGSCPSWQYNYSFISIRLFQALYRKGFISIPRPFTLSQHDHGNDSLSGIKIQDTVYPLLNGAYEVACSQAQTMPVIISLSERDSMMDRYTLICNQIKEGLDSIGALEEISNMPVKLKKPWLLHVEWNRYWNLIALLPPDHLFIKIILDFSGGATQKAVTLLGLERGGGSHHHYKKEKDTGKDEGKFKDTELNTKTQNSLKQWWENQVWSPVLPFLHVQPT